MAITALDKGSIHRITSGQVAVDLATCVKELVENSLDAHAKSVEVRFKNYGLDGIEVVDNGDGISEDDLNNIAMKHHTSKIREFDDLETVETFGFRGEAMSSLCALCNVSIITCDAKTVPKATQLTFDHNGNVLSKTMVSGVKGTSVRLENLFTTLPVRRKEFEKIYKREYAKAVEWIQAYAVALERVKVSVTHTLPSKKKSSLFGTPGGSMRHNIATVYGANSLETLLPVDFKVEWSKKTIMGKVDSEGNEDEKRPMKLVGYISKPIFGMGRNSKDRQLFFINSRPCILPRLAKEINELYKMYNTVQYPIIVADLHMDPRCYDVNVTPDKRTILLNDEDTIIGKIKEQLLEIFEKAGHSVPSNEKIEEKPTIVKQQKLNFLSQFKNEESNSQKNDHNVSDNDDESTSSSLDEEEQRESPPPKKLSDEIKTASAGAANSSIRHIRQPRYYTGDGEEEDDLAAVESKRRKMTRNVVTQSNSSGGFSSSLKQFVSSSSSSASQNYAKAMLDTETTVVSEEENDAKLHHIPSNQEQEYQEPMEIEKEETSTEAGGNEKVHDHYHDHGHDHDDSLVVESESEYEPDINNGTPIEEDESLTVQNIEELDPSQRTFSRFVKNIKRQKHHHTAQSSVTISQIRQGFKRGFRAAKTLSRSPQDLTAGISKSDIEQDTEEAERLLNLTIKKEDFTKMKVVGQFNKGFILVTKEKTSGKPGKDMFIVDQHASDEKYNFEKLQRETLIKKQPLVIPRPLQLSVVDEITLSSNIDLVAKNGFGVIVDEEGVPGSKAKLASLPLSKNTVFNESDLDELIYLIQESPGNESIRCSKVRTMFASRACRSSIMIGQSLNLKIMQRVVQNLAGLDKPWNCPHGRPTLRHLTRMDQFVGFNMDYIWN